MPTLNAYLSFDGDCAAAMKFYARVLDAKLEALITYAQMPRNNRCLRARATGSCTPTWCTRSSP